MFIVFGGGGSILLVGLVFFLGIYRSICVGLILLSIGLAVVMYQSDKPDASVIVPTNSHQISSGNTLMDMKAAFARH